MLRYVIFPLIRNNEFGEGTSFGVSEQFNENSHSSKPTLLQPSLIRIRGVQSEDSTVVLLSVAHLLSVNKGNEVQNISIKKRGKPG